MGNHRVSRITARQPDNARKRRTPAKVPGWRWPMTPPKHWIMLSFEHDRPRARCRITEQRVSHEGRNRPGRSLVFGPDARLVQDESEDPCGCPPGRVLQRQQPIADYFRES